MVVTGGLYWARHSPSLSLLYTLAGTDSQYSNILPHCQPHVHVAEKKTLLLQTLLLQKTLLLQTLLLQVIYYCCKLFIIVASYLLLFIVIVIYYCCKLFITVANNYCYCYCCKPYCCIDKADLHVVCFSLTSTYTESKLCRDWKLQSAKVCAVILVSALLMVFVVFVVITTTLLGVSILIILQGHLHVSLQPTCIINTILYIKQKIFLQCQFQAKTNFAYVSS